MFNSYVRLPEGNWRCSPFYAGMMLYDVVQTDIIITCFLTGMHIEIWRVGKQGDVH